MVAWITWTLAATACAEEAPRTLEIGFGARAGAVFGDLCYRGGDVVGCSNGAVFAGVQLAPRWRFARAWSIGGLGTAAFGAGMYPQTWWSAAGEARVHPFDLGSTDVAFGLDAGLVAVVEQAPLAADSTTTLAPALGALFGVDFAISSAFALGFELRALSFLFGRGEDIPADQSMSYGTQTGASLTVAGTFRK